MSTSKIALAADVDRRRIPEIIDKLCAYGFLHQSNLKGQKKKIYLAGTRPLHHENWDVLEEMFCIERAKPERKEAFEKVRDAWSPLALDSESPAIFERCFDKKSPLGYFLGHFEWIKGMPCLKEFGGNPNNHAPTYHPSYAPASIPDTPSSKDLAPLISDAIAQVANSSSNLPSS